MHDVFGWFLALLGHQMLPRATPTHPCLSSNELQHAYPTLIYVLECFTHVDRLRWFGSLLANQGEFEVQYKPATCM